METKRNNKHSHNTIHETRYNRLLRHTTFIKVNCLRNQIYTHFTNKNQDRKTKQNTQLYTDEKPYCEMTASMDKYELNIASFFRNRYGSEKQEAVYLPLILTFDRFPYIDPLMRRSPLLRILNAFSFFRCSSSLIN